MAQNNVEGFRLSPQQKYLWSVQQTSASYPYQVLSKISIDGELRTEVLQRAFAEVVRRHEILRTTFQRPPGIRIPFQVISDEPHISWQFCDLSDLDQESRLRQIDHYFLDQLGQTFDLECGPLLRNSLYRLTPEHHVLLVSLPAVCADPVTLSNLMNEVAAGYKLILQGGEPASGPMQYADFAEWHNQLLEVSDEQADAGRSYWQELMAAGSSFTLPLEKRTTNDQTFRAQAVSIDLDSTCVTNVETFARECRTSIQVVLFAFWQALIWRLANRSDLIIFNQYHGRTLEDLSSALGPYAKYLPVACRCEDIPFVAHLEATRTAVDDAEEWQDYFDPSSFFEATRNSVAFDFAEDFSAIGVAGLEFSSIKQEVCLGPFKLRLSCSHSKGSIRAHLFYDSHSFDRETINCYAGYFTSLIAQGRAAPTIGTIDILSDGERERLLVDINQTAAEFSAAKSIHKLFEEQVEHTPAATALVCGDREISYLELNAAANRIAHLLRHRGIAPNMRVGIYIERSAETIIAMLGILKAGGAYVPLNPEHPRARLMMQLAESNTAVLITNGGAAADALGFGGGEIVDLERDRALLSTQPDSNPPSIGAAANLAYIIYTSGSSGIPKGVAVSHQALVNYTQFILRRLHVKEPLNFVTVSTITADLGNTCIFPALVSGGCLHLINYDVAMEGALFSEYVAKRPVDVLKIVPSHFSALRAAGGNDNIFPRKFLIFGGEALTWELVDHISQAAPSCEIINHYGPTETTVGSLTFDVKPHKLSTHSSTVPIGQPIANTRVYILDQQLNVTPTGVAGELYIGGAGLALGYLNQPVETAARFVPNPFAENPGERFYRTGDRARYLPDGNIEFLGRIDHQVKVRGFRVELGEIESVLLKYKQVRQAVVIADRATDNQRLVAYVCATGTSRPRVDDLRTFLGQHLPEYMIPSSFVFLKTMPLTSNGKVDRAALPAPDEARPNLERRFVAPRTGVEKELADIWAGFLKLTEVGIHDNFFELGGHSLLATQVVSRMRKKFNCEVPLRSLFEFPTIADLAVQIAGSATDTERLLAEIEELSDAEVANILEREQT